MQGGTQQQVQAKENLFPLPRAIAELINQKGGQAGLSGIRAAPAWS